MFFGVSFLPAVAFTAACFMIGSVAHSKGNGTPSLQQKILLYMKRPLYQMIIRDQNDLTATSAFHRVDLSEKNPDYLGRTTLSCMLDAGISAANHVDAGCFSGEMRGKLLRFTSTGSCSRINSLKRE
jgi:hypothetical protein